MTGEDKRIIEKELDKIIDKFNEEGFDIQKFINYSKILKQAFLNNVGLHRKPRKCVFPNCTNRSIRKSHSIPKTSSLTNIASKGHLLTPKFDFSNSSIPSIAMKLVGINDASVFSGYCKKHENMFQTFEAEGEINDARKALLQTYRTLCRERVYREIEININEIIKKIYRDKVNEEALKNVTNSLRHVTHSDKINNIEIKGVDSVLDYIDRLNKYLNDINIVLVELENKIYQNLFCGSEGDDLIINVINIDIKFPISLSGFANQPFKENGNEKDAHIFLNIIPLKDSTCIICVGFERDAIILEKYFEYSFSSPLNILNMIESFMINGSDHWYINPDYWENMSKQKQEKILYDILNTEQSFLDEYPISIFDDIRINVLSILKENTKHRKLTIIEKERINKEMQKIAAPNYEITHDDEKFIDRLLNKLKRI